jgi:hypothetical protein
VLSNARRWQNSKKIRRSNGSTRILPAFLKNRLHVLPCSEVPITGDFSLLAGGLLCGERRPFDTAELGNWKSASLITKARCEMARVAQTKLLMRRRASSRFYYASNHRSHSGVRFRTRNRDKCYRLALCSAGATPGHRQFNADLAHSRRLPLDRR